MYNIVICEDNFDTGIILKKIIVGYFKEKDLDHTFKLFNQSFEKVIDFAKCNIDNINIYFIDIVLNDEQVSGLSLARQIREVDIMAYLIFVTSHPEFSLRIFNYKLKALDCIFKQELNIKSRIYECLDTIVFESSKIEQLNIPSQIALKGVNELYTINQSDVLYFETRPGSRLLYCVLIDGSCIPFRNTLKELIKDLGSQFFQCHRSYIINTKQIKKMFKDRQSYCVMMNNDQTCDVSRLKWKELYDHVSN
ncbi:MAG TPA: LytTR family DNA-binding domain-containing protein [Thermoclostridium sp.]|nr:LytTR family DNA-binding domain-containing protein [Thermoclostridium sp.]